MMKFWEDLTSGARKAIIVMLAVFALGIASAITSCVAEAVEPGWYSPMDGSGQAIIVRCNSADECVTAWITHDKNGGQLWLISLDLCKRAEPCDLNLSETTGLWNVSESAELAEPTVSLELTQTENGVNVEWNAMLQFPDACFDIGIGGLLSRGCIGQREFVLLAR